MKFLQLILMVSIITIGCNNTNTSDNLVDKTKVITKDSINTSLSKSDVKIPIQKEEILYYYTACDSFAIDSNINITEKLDSILTLNQNTNVYCSPFQTVHSIDQIPFNTWVNFEELIQDKSTSGKWLKIRFNGEYGYIKHNELFDEKVGRYPNYISIGDSKSHRIIKSYTSNNPNVLIDSFLFRYAAVENYLEELEYNGLNNTQTVLRYTEVSQTGGGVQIVNINDEGEISLIISSDNNVDWEYSLHDDFYYPLRIKDSTYLVAEARVIVIYNKEEDQINQDAMNSNIFSYPKNIPINELIVKNSEEYHPIIKNGEMVTDDGTDSGMPLLELTKSVKTYYRWNGDSLIQYK